MFPILFKIGPLTLHTYGLLIALGFLAGYTVARGRFQERTIPLSLLEQLVVYVMLAGLLGARSLYFLLNEPAALLESPLEFFKVWEGGLVFYGGLGAGVLTVFIFSRMKEIRFLLLSDALVPSLLLAQAIGRLGCFSAGCCYGKSTSSFLGVLFSDPESLGPRFFSVHPVQLYESLAVFLLFFGAMRLNNRTPATAGGLNIGLLTAFYLMTYSLVRFLMEFFRGDNRGAMLQGLSPGQIISLVLMVAGVGLWFHVRKNKPF